MELQMHTTGGLLAAVARCLDALAAAAAQPAAENGSGGGASSKALFEQTLLSVVAQAQRLLRYVLGGCGACGTGNGCVIDRSIDRLQPLLEVAGWPGLPAWLSTQVQSWHAWAVAPAQWRLAAKPLLPSSLFWCPSLLCVCVSVVCCHAVHLLGLTATRWMASGAGRSCWRG
jgi:hypothetical protein